MRYISIRRRALALLLCMCFMFSSIATFNIPAIALPLSDSAFSVTIKIEKDWGGGTPTDDTVEYTISYTQDNVPKSRTETVTKDGGWVKEVTGLPKYNANGTEIAYTVTENASEKQKEKYYTHLIQGSSNTERTLRYVTSGFDKYSSGRYLIANTSSSECLTMTDNVKYKMENLPRILPINNTNFSARNYSINDGMLWDLIPNTTANRGWFLLRNVETTKYAQTDFDGVSGDSAYRNGDIERNRKYIFYTSSLGSPIRLRYYDGTSTYPYWAGNSYGYRFYEVRSETTSTVYTFKSQLKTKKDILKHTKTITHLDEESNKNTDTAIRGEDLYRLYLDVAGPAPIDLLLVLDRSSSMLEGLDGTVGVPLEDSKYWKVMEVLNGTNGETGAIEEFFKENAENRLAIIDFGGRITKIGSGDPVPITSAQGYDYIYDTKPITTTDGSTIEWQEDPFKLVQGTPTSGEREFQFEINSGDATNYSAAFKMASKAFDELVPKPDHRKMMVFLSDGAPTLYIDAHYNRFGNGNYLDGNLISCIGGAKISFDEFCENHPDVTSHSLGFSDDPVTKVQFNEILEYIASKREDSKFEPASNNAAIRKYLRNLTLVKSMKISDSLSENVALYDTPDYVVTMKNKDGTAPVVLYDDKDGGLKTTANGTAPDNILDVTEPISVSTDPTSKKSTVTLNFNKDYEIPTDKIFTISFNVKVTEEAYKKRVDNIVNGVGNVNDEGVREGYPDTGDLGTDYLVDNNDTSSEKPGFYSNDHAEITYIYADEKNNIREPYRMPVVQTHDVSLTIKKIGEGNAIPLSGAKFKLYSDDGTLDGKLVTAGADADGCFTTGPGGTVTISPLAPGKYFIEETTPPADFAPLTGRAYFTLYRDTIVIDTDRSTGQIKKLFQGDTEVKDPATLTVINKKYSLKILKKGSDGIGLAPLPGAGFNVYADPGCTSLAADIYTDSTMQNAQVEGSNRTSDPDGILQFYGLCRGKTYYVKEVYTPTGYSILSDPVKIEILSDGKKIKVDDDREINLTDEDMFVIQLTITDPKFVWELPQTGYSGIVLLLIISTVMTTAAFAAFVVAYKKRPIKQ